MNSRSREEYIFKHSFSNIISKNCYYSVNSKEFSFYFNFQTQGNNEQNRFEVESITVERRNFVSFKLHKLDIIGESVTIWHLSKAITDDETQSRAGRCVNGSNLQKKSAKSNNATNIVFRVSRARKKSPSRKIDGTIGANVALTWSDSVQLNLTLDPCARNAPRPIRIASKRLGLRRSSMLTISTLIDKRCKTAHLSKIIARA